MCDKYAVVYGVCFLVSLFIAGLIALRMPKPPSTLEAPDGMISFQLAERPAARRIWEAWKEAGGLPMAQSNLRYDQWLIGAYLCSYIFLSLLVARLSGFSTPWSLAVAAGLILIAGIGAAADVCENRHISRLLTADATQWDMHADSGAVKAKRCAARVKFVSLLMVYPPFVMAVLITALLRTMCRSS